MWWWKLLDYPCQQIHSKSFPSTQLLTCLNPVHIPDSHGVCITLGSAIHIAANRAMYSCTTVSRAVRITIGCDACIGIGIDPGCTVCMFTLPSAATILFLSSLAVLLTTPLSAVMSVSQTAVLFILMWFISSPAMCLHHQQLCWFSCTLCIMQWNLADFWDYPDGKQRTIWIMGHSYAYHGYCHHS